MSINKKRHINECNQKLEKIFLNEIKTCIKENLVSISYLPNHPNVTVSSTAQNDQINQSLLDDIQTAAQRAGLKIQIGTAKTGHREKTTSGFESRHMGGNAIDIPMIDNIKVTDSAGKQKADKFVSTLESMGYQIGAETNNPKAILWQTKDHYDHIHVSNTSGSVGGSNGSGDSSGGDLGRAIASGQSSTPARDLAKQSLSGLFGKSI